MGARDAGEERAPVGRGDGQVSSVWNKRGVRRRPARGYDAHRVPRQVAAEEEQEQDGCFERRIVHHGEAS